MSDLITMMSAAAGQGGINPREHFDTVLWTGDGSDPQSISGLSFQPDFVWGKARNNNNNNTLTDAVRGATNTLFSNLTNAESVQSLLTAFNSDGFDASGGFNVLGRTHVGWCWKANGAGVSNTDGTITSTVSANTTAGISIVTYTGNGNANATVGHGLGVIPAMIIVKQRNTTGPWYVKHASLSSNNNLLLNGTDAAYNVATGSSDGGLGNLSSATTFGFLAGTSNVSAVNENTGTFVALVFSEVKNFSAFGSYTGNGSATGPSVTTDFEPTWLMIKRTDTTGNWTIYDSVRSPTNPRTAYLLANTNGAEQTGLDVDFNATGFQLKSTNANVNSSGGTYIYACFA